jgi:hypothetical protein
VSVSFMPDGTLIAGTYPSNLFAVYNAAYPQATWQRQVAMALQSWADVSNLNFHFVSDTGAPQGTSGLPQGDNRFGDIRIGGYSMGSGILGIGWNPNNTATGGDVELNTASAFAIGSMPDLASVMMHEGGHAIGFNHTLVNPAVMEGGLWGIYPGPYPDDIAGVQAMYGARKADVFDATASNDTLSTATALTLSYGGIAFQADISTMTDVDYYKITAPAGTNGNFTVSVDARNLSLFDPKVSVYNASGALLGTASASTYGDVAAVNLTGLVAGQTYYLEASGATNDSFGMGAYQLSAQFGGFTPPPIGPDAFEPNNTVGSATNFGKISTLSQTALTLSSTTDVDYYSFVAVGKGTYTVSITPTQGSGVLGLTVLSAQQTVLASGQSQTGGVSLSVSVTSGTQYFIKVSSPSASQFAYNLSIGSAGGGGGGGGGHHLVAMGVPNTIGREQGDVFYQKAAEDPDNADSVVGPPASGFAHSEISRPVMPAQASAVIALSDGRILLDTSVGQRPAIARPSTARHATPNTSTATPVPAALVAGLLDNDGPRVRLLTEIAPMEMSDWTSPSGDASDPVVLVVPMPTSISGDPAGPDATPNVGLGAQPLASLASLVDDSEYTGLTEFGAPSGAAGTADCPAVDDSLAAGALAIFVGCAHWVEGERYMRRRLKV